METVDDDSMSAFWRDWDEESKERRAKHREKSAALLQERGIEFETKNGGAHLIVRHGDKVTDFWPGTGKWIVRQGKKGRGVFPLLKEIGAGQ